MQNPKLTKKQRQLVSEVKQLVLTLDLDPDEIANTIDHECRTTALELAKNQIVRSAVILKYVLMDEHLNCVI